MMTLATILSWSLVVYLTPLFAFLALVTMAALFGGRGRRQPVGEMLSAATTRFLFVIPAHDEEAGIAATVASCRAVAYDPSAFSVAVIADNCTDATAAVARDAGAEVFERHDPSRRSKGYALEDFFRHRQQAGEAGQFGAAVVVDADTLVASDLLVRFAEAVEAGADWAQAYYSVRNPDVSWRTRLMTYAFSLFNGVWLLGQDRLGLSVGLRGNGMCLTARGLARVPWRAYGLVEDHEFSWVLRLAGERVRFVPGARVDAEMVSRGREAVSQRKRWEEGRRSLRSRFLRSTLASPALSIGQKVLSLIELAFPPLTTLFAALGLALLIHPAAWLLPPLVPLSRSLLPVHLAMVATAIGYMMSPFLVLRLPPRYALSLAAAPYFAVWKLATAVGTRSTGWVRTPREQPGDATVPARDPEPVTPPTL